MSLILCSFVLSQLKNACEQAQRVCVWGRFHTAIKHYIPLHRNGHKKRCRKLLKQIKVQRREQMECMAVALTLRKRTVRSIQTLH